MFPCVSHAVFLLIVSSSFLDYRWHSVRVHGISELCRIFLSFLHMVSPLSMVVLYQFLPVFVMCVEPFSMILFVFLRAGGIEAWQFNNLHNVFLLYGVWTMHFSILILTSEFFLGVRSLNNYWTILFIHSLLPACLPVCLPSVRPSFLPSFLPSWFVSFLCFTHWPLMHSLIHSLTHSLIHSFNPSFIHSFIHYLAHWFTHSFIHSFVHSFINILCLSFFLIHSFIHSFIQACIRPFILSCMHTFTNVHAFNPSFMSFHSFHFISSHMLNELILSGATPR